MARPEAKIENYLVTRCEAAGALVRKLSYVGRRGASDRMVVWPEREWTPDGWTFIAETRVDFVELKAFGKKPDPHQEREHQRLRDLGANVYVIDSKEAVDRYVKERTS